MEEDNMYWNEPEQRLDPPEINTVYESVIEEADIIVGKISKLHDKVESFFEELTVRQIEDILYEAKELLDELGYLSSDEYSFDDEYYDGKWRVEEIESWMNEKEDIIKTEGDE
jgi:di/tripeptidase